MSNLAKVILAVDGIKRDANVIFDGELVNGCVEIYDIESVEFEINQCWIDFSLEQIEEMESEIIKSIELSVTQRRAA